MERATLPVGWGRMLPTRPRAPGRGFLAGRGLGRNRAVGARRGAIRWRGRWVAHHGCDPAALEVEGAEPGGPTSRAEGKVSSIGLPVNLRRPLRVPVSIHEQYAIEIN